MIVLMPVQAMIPSSVDVAGTGYMGRMGMMFWTAAPMSMN
jgi:hypothetical protein